MNWKLPQKYCSKHVNDLLAQNALFEERVPNARAILEHQTEPSTRLLMKAVFSDHES